MVTWRVILSREAVKDARRLRAAGLRAKTTRLLSLIESDPFAYPPRWERLVGNLDGFFSRRINIQHRLVYRVDRELRVVHVLRMWSHYE